MWRLVQSVQLILPRGEKEKLKEAVSDIKWVEIFPFFGKPFKDGATLGLLSALSCHPLANNDAFILNKRNICTCRNVLCV